MQFYADIVIKARISLASSSRGGMAAQCSDAPDTNTHSRALAYSQQAEVDTAAGLREGCIDGIPTQHSFNDHGFHEIPAELGVPLFDLVEDVE